MLSKRFSFSRKNNFASRTLLIILGTLLFTLSFVLWQTHENKELAALKQRTEDKALSLASETESLYRSLHQALERMSNKPVSQDPTSDAQWDQEATIYLETYNGISAIARIDNAFYIRQMVPGQVENIFKDQPAVNIEMSPSTVTILLAQSNKDKSLGFLMGIVELEDMIKPLVQEINPTYMVQLLNQTNPIYSSENWQSPRQGFTAQKNLSLEDTAVLELMLAPSENEIERVVADARNILWFGMGFSIITVSSVFFAQNSTKKAYLNELRYQNLFNSSQTAIFVINLEGAFEDANPAAEQLTGYSRAALKMMTVKDLLFHEEDFILHSEAGLWTEGGELAVSMKHQDGHEIPVELTTSAVWEKGVQKWVLGMAQDITDRQRTQRILRLRLELMELSVEESLAIMLQTTLDEVCALTNSAIGFFHFVDEDQATLSLQAWSTRTTEEFCQVGRRGEHYPIDQAGVWVDCVHARQPVIHNDYESLPHRKGLPEGHAEVVRELVVPVLRQDKVVAILGVGNKPDDYTQTDVEVVNYLADVCWDIVERKRSEEEKTQQNSLLEAIYANAPLIMMLVDDQRRVHQANDFAAQFSGRSPEEMLGLRGGEALRCLHALDSPGGCGFGPYCHQCTVKNTILDTLKTGSVHQKIEASLPINVSGQEQHLSFMLSSAPITIAEDRMALVTMLDITDRVQSERQSQYLFKQQLAVNKLSMALGKNIKPHTIYQLVFNHVRTMLNFSEFYFYTYDPYANVLKPAFAARENAVLSPVEIPTISLVEHQPDCLEKVISLGQTYYHPGLSVEDGSDQEPAEKKSDNVSTLCIPMMVMGDVVGMMHLKSPKDDVFNQADRDLLDTIANMAATSLQNARLVDTLEEEVNTRTSELEEKVTKLDKSQKAMLYMVEDLNQTGADLRSEREKLTQSNQELGAFSYSVSHDLRAPLRHINGYIDLLVKRCPDSLPENGQHYLENIVDSANEMGVLIDSLLQFSRTSRQKMHQTRLDMNDIVQEALVNLKIDYQNRDIAWQVNVLPEVFGDRYLLKLVWLNLLSNAIKYTQQKADAQIEIGFMDESDEFVFFVRDNGVGFDMKYSHKLFGVFQRLHSAREFQGTGIGLANIRRIIQRHGGRTWAEGEPEHGATFYFSLPKEER